MEKIPNETSNRYLEVDRIINTTRALYARISERFPNSGLSKVARETLRVAEEAAERSLTFSRPNLLIRSAAALLAALILTILGWMFSNYHEYRVADFGEFIQTLESGISAMTFTAAGVWFLFTLESRRNKQRALSAIYELHSLAHIVDMHQLTKDTDHYIFKGPDTKSSPRRELTPFQLSRYLDYCVEILSLLGKISVVYTQNLRDAEVAAATDKLEDLVLGLSTKITNKLNSLERLALHDEKSANPK